MKSQSLRIRIILWLMLILGIAGILATTGRYILASHTAENLLDKTLLAVAHTVARDVVISGGDVLAEELLETLTDALGDQIFYNIRGPGPTLVTGYTDPPQMPAGQKISPGKPLFFSSNYHGDEIRVVALKEFIANNVESGWIDVKVWQTVRKRKALSLQLAMRTAAIMITLLIVTLVTLWFAVNRALRPLLKLEASINRRSPDDLTAIRQVVPREVRGIVKRMNALLARLTTAFAEKDAFISDAAHQLRNPIAALQSQAEAAARAKNEHDLRVRTNELVEATRRTSRLTRQLLSMEKAKGRNKSDDWKILDVSGLVEEASRNVGARALQKNVELNFHAATEPALAHADPLMIGEAVENLIDNSLRYGAQKGGVINVFVTSRDNNVIIAVEDNGPGVEADQQDHIFERFVRGVEGRDDGCGLGLSIVREIAKQHGGTARLKAQSQGVCFEILMPRLEADAN